jgi:hypothetical protein
VHSLPERLHCVCVLAEQAVGVPVQLLSVVHEQPVTEEQLLSLYVEQAFTEPVQLYELAPHEQPEPGLPTLVQADSVDLELQAVTLPWQWAVT